MKKKKDTILDNGKRIKKNILSPNMIANEEEINSKREDEKIQEKSVIDFFFFLLYEI